MAISLFKTIIQKLNDNLSWLFLLFPKIWDFIPVFILFLFLFFTLRFCVSWIAFRWLVSVPFLPIFSKTEKIALKIDSSGIEKSFFTGGPSITQIFNPKHPCLSQEEKNFLTRPCEELCSLSSEWDFMQKRKLQATEEKFLQEKHFFGLTIPKKYQGLGFSPFAHAKVIEKIASHNLPLSIIVMVPNSLGPAELLLKYGTENQKQTHLPALAKGQKWPCFALTETLAGSDATSIQSEGILFKQGGDLKIKLNFEKRWISLASKADLIALAIQLKDPQQVYSQKKDLGISCVLIPRHLKGVKIEGRHDPMGLPIYNAPIKGENVTVLAKEAIIGGIENAGKGWEMIMESLSRGRAISLPSLSIAAAKKTAWLTGTHAFIRRQFGLPIGKFKAIQEPLAFITGVIHLMTVTQNFSLSLLNSKQACSPVISALIKYQLTEIGQKVIKKGMDIMGGAGLSLGPKNKIALLYSSLPLAITVEGANILTRSFVIYGQALIKLHPYIQALILSVEQKKYKAFHQSFWKFVLGFFSYFLKSLLYYLACLFMNILFFLIDIINFLYSLFFALLKVFALKTPKKKFLQGPFKIKKYQYFVQLKFSSCLFRFLSDLNLIFLGGKLKKEGQFMGRFADILSGLFMISALLWEQKHKNTDPLLTKWGIEYSFLKIQKNFIKILQDYPRIFIRFLLKPFLWLLRLQVLSSGPSDSLNQKLAQKLLLDPEFKKSLCENMYQSKEDHLQKLNRAYELSLKEEQIKKQKANKAQKEFSEEELSLFKQAEKARYEAIQVDVFSDRKYFNS